MSEKKSDFIVNMTKEGFNKLFGLYFIIASCLYFVAQAVYYCTKDMSYGKTELGVSLLMTDRTLPIQFLVIIVTGFLAVLPFLIGALKKYITKAHIKVLAFPLGFTALAVIACLLAYNSDFALYGQTGRYDGAITQLAYFFLFAGAMMLSDAGWLKKIVYTIIVIGTVQAVIGILQAVPALSEIIPTFYNLRMGYSDIYCANGFTSSPYFLVTILSMTSALSAVMFMYEKSRKLSIFLLISILLSSAACALSHLFTGLIAIIAALLPSLIIEIIRLAKKKAYTNGKKLENPVFRSVTAIILSGVVFGVCMITGGFEDRAVAVEDGLFRLFISGQEDLSSDSFFYFDEWKESLTAIKDKPVFGTGGDCYADYIYGSNASGIMGSFDRPYNDYLYIAASKGIPCLILYLGFIVTAIIATIKRIKAFYEHKEDCMGTALGCALIAYAVVMLFCAASISSTPYFFILAGLLFSMHNDSTMHN